MSDALDALLLVQERDIALDQLRHRSVALPARADLDGALATLRGQEVALAEATRRRDVALAEETALDHDAQSLGAKADAVHEKLYSGTVVSPRELQALQADLDMLRRQRSELEDRELEVMSVREELDAGCATARAAVEATRAEVDRLRRVIAEAESELAAEAATEEAVRADHASRVPADLLADYERRRSRNRGNGAARLVGNTCQACRLTIPATEVDRIRHGASGAVAYCDNCGAILVPS